MGWDCPRLSTSSIAIVFFFSFCLRIDLHCNVVQIDIVRNHFPNPDFGLNRINIAQHRGARTITADNRIDRINGIRCKKKNI